MNDDHKRFFEDLKCGDIQYCYVIDGEKESVYRVVRDGTGRLWTSDIGPGKYLDEVPGEVVGLVPKSRTIFGMSS